MRISSENGQSRENGDMRSSVVWVVLALALAACGDPKLKVGLNVGLAGADVGALAASEIRMSKVAKDRRFEVRIANQRAVALGTITAAGMAASLDSIGDDEKVGVVLSRFLSREELSVARRYKQQRIPFISVTALPDGVAAGNGPGFSLVPSLKKQGEFMAEQARAGNRIAIVHLDNMYGQQLAAEIVTALNARGMKPVDVRKYQQSWDEPRVVALGSELENKSDPDLIFFIGRGPTLELVWQPFRETSKEIRVIGSDLVESAALYVNPGGKYTGLKYVRWFDPRSKEERMSDLSTRYGMWTGRGDMTTEAVFIYDGMKVIGEAVRSGARTRDELIQYFASLGKSRPPYNGVGGLIAFEADGTVNRPFQLAEVRADGVFTVEQ